MAEAKAFHKTTWAKVEAGDVVLMAWGLNLGQIVEIAITEVKTMKSKVDGKVFVLASFDLAGNHYPERSFDPRRVAYVQSRL